MFSALPRTAPQALMNQAIQLCATATHQILLAHATASGDHSKVDYEYTHDDARVRFLERIQHGLTRNPDAQELHESWRHLMLLDDWRHGIIYCPTSKTDPHLIDFHKLDATRRFKDEIVLCSILHHSATQ